MALIVAVFTASLLGSLHCAGMCGAFLAFAVGDVTITGPGAPGISRRGRLRGGAAPHCAYHAGRLMTYSALGVISGSLGAALDLGGAMVGVQRIAAALAGAVMIGFGTVTLLRLRGVRIGRLPLPGVAQRVLVRGQRWALNRPPVHRALLIGLLTTLLPCGWLYAFAITAAGTADPGLGALTMAVFWAGTLPVMVGLGAGVSAAAGALGRRLPVVTAMALLGVGIFTVAQRLTISADALVAGDRGIIPIGTRAAAERAAGLNDGHLPCCEDR
jgi:sulfite exporter TauE/SafE